MWSENPIREYTEVFPGDWTDFLATIQYEEVEFDHELGIPISVLAEDGYEYVLPHQEWLDMIANERDDVREINFWARQ